MREGIALACAAVLAGCGGEPTSPSGLQANCRAYPVAVSENGGPEVPCQLEQGGVVTLRCGTALSPREWHYASLADFIDEARVPNRLRLRSFSSATFSLLHSSGGSGSDYEYDAQERLIARERSSWSGFQPWMPFERAEFTAWDDRGRPTAGALSDSAGTRPITLTYDDQRREMRWSTGEIHRVDRWGNTVLQEFGSFRRQLTILRTELACR
jgi:hypothetical protein